MAAVPGYPPAPWGLQGQGWLSLFRVRRAGLRPDGLYVAAFVSYEPDSPLTYSELLVARVLDRRQVEITDIWVDSVASRDGGRALWAIPKELCDFTREHRRTGPLSRTTWSAGVGRRPIAEASFTDASKFAPRLPFGAGTRQPTLAAVEGAPVTATFRGSAKALACRGSWAFDAAGPLGWLHGQRRVGSFRVADFRMQFGA